MINERDKLEPLWFDGDILPQDHTDMVTGDNTDSSNSQEFEDTDVDFAESAYLSAQDSDSDDN